MKRFAFLAAAALLGTACGTSTPTPPPPSGAIDFSWQFMRYVNDTTATIPYTCAQAQIDHVMVSFDVGGDVIVPCSDNAGDGARLTGVRVGTRSVRLTGLRGGVDLFRSSAFAVDVQDGLVTTTPVVDVDGIADNLYVYANFLGQYGQNMNWVTCADVNVQTITYTIVDVANTVIASGSASCTDPAGVSFVGSIGKGALDRDNYAIRMTGVRTGTGTVLDSASEVAPPAPHNCNGQAFDHFGPNDTWDVWLYDVTQNSTFCP